MSTWQESKGEAKIEGQDHFGQIVLEIGIEYEGYDQSTALQPHSNGVKIQDLPCSIIKDKYMMKAQVHVSDSSAISNIQALPRKKHYCQIYHVVKHMLRGRLLASFQDLEHEGGDTRIARRHKIQG
nr:hypothetical protein [Tanacetum cinerariifolium]